MKVRVNCPISGCGIQVQVQNLPRHLEGVHELDGELVLKLHPTSPYQVIWPRTLTEAAESELEPEQKTGEQGPGEQGSGEQGPGEQGPGEQG